MANDDYLKQTIETALAAAKPRDLHRTLFNLADCYNQTAEMALSRISSSSNADFAAPAIMCRSFAIELLLKFFIVVEHPLAKSKTELKSLGANLNGHTYSQLFDRISPFHQQLIANEHSESTGTPTSTAMFRRFLISIGDKPFVDWRYIYEESCQKNIDMELFACLAESLGLAAQDVTRSVS